MKITKLKVSVIFSAFMLCNSMQSHAHEIDSGKTLPIQSLQYEGQLPVIANGATDLKFNEIFKLPVGPRGMEPSEKLLSLDNKRVRIIGYMAKQESPTPGLFILSPLPVNMGDEDDKFADDMPANSIFIHLNDSNVLVSYIPGLINLTGVLSVGNINEADGRISYVRIQLNPKTLDRKPSGPAAKYP